MSGKRQMPRVEIYNVLKGAASIDSMGAYIANPNAQQASKMACNYLVAIIMYETTTVTPTLATSNPANLALIQDLTPDLVADPRPPSTP